MNNCDKKATNAKVIFGDFIKDAKTSIIIIGLFLIVTYWTRVTSFSFGIDTELYIRNYLGSYEWNNALGRWGLVLLNKILSMGPLIVPLANTLTLLFIFLYSILMCYLFYLLITEESRKRYAKYCFVFAIVFITSPIFAEQYNFTLQSAAVSLAICMMTVSLIIIHIMGDINNKLIKCVLFFTSIVFNVISFATYQSIILLYVVCVVGCYLLKCTYENTLSWKYLVKNICVFIFSSIVYYLIVKLLGEEVGNSYLNSGWGEGGVSCLRNIAEVVSATLKCETIYYNIGYPIAIAIVIMSNLVLLFENRYNIGILIGSASLLISPFFINMVTGVEQLKRTQFNYSFTIGFSILYVILIIKETMPFRKWLLYTLTCVGIVISCKQSYISAALFYSQDVVYESDIAYTNRIETEIEHSEWYNPLQKYKLVFIGKRENQPHNRFVIGEVMGQSVYEFDYLYRWGTTDRANAVFMTLGYYYDVPSPEEYDFAKELAIKNDAPIFPKVGSIINYNDLIIVRLSQEIQ